METATEQMVFEIIKIGLIMIAALFTYYKFFREGAHRQRIEFDIDFHNLGLKKSERIIEIGALAENKGNVEQKFNSMRLRIRGIDKKSELTELRENKPRLVFPENLKKVSPESDIIVCKRKRNETCPENLKKLPAENKKKACIHDSTKLCPRDPNKIEMIPEKFEFYFVRPGVKQRFPIVVKIPSNWTHILVKITFNYKGTKNIHVAERAFRVNIEN